MIFQIKNPDDKFLNVDKINPIKQHLVAQIVKEAEKDEYIKRLIIFGSSIRDDCRNDSDIDICIDWTEECYDEYGVLKEFTNPFLHFVSIYTEGNVDFVYYDYLAGMYIEKDVRKEGVVVYGKH